MALESSLPARPKARREKRRTHHSNKEKHDAGIELNPARVFLFVACFWPLWVMALFASSATNQEASPPSNNEVKSILSKETRFKLRTALDRVDVVGYGPTHPRIAVVIVAEQKDLLFKTIESVISNTDLNRIFVICAVLEGYREDAQVIEKIHRMDAGSVPHWHGLRPDIHLSGSKSKDDDPHDRKIYTMFNEEKIGMAASRKDAVDFIQLLEQKHENAGIKSSQEDLILVFLQEGAEFKDRKWLGPVTSSLIVPPPIMGRDDENIAMKLANAVSFNVDGPGKRTSFDEKLSAIVEDVPAADINLSGGLSYPTPAFHDGGIALRLDTFASLPAQDEFLMDAWTANLELSLNLWLCGDGIDLLQNVDLVCPKSWTGSLLEQEQAARFAAAWLEESVAYRFLQHYSESVTRLEWDTLMAEARRSEGFPLDIQKKCRSFDWYLQEVNTALGESLALPMAKMKKEEATDKKELPMTKKEYESHVDAIKDGLAKAGDSKPAVIPSESKEAPSKGDEGGNKAAKEPQVKPPEVKLAGDSAVKKSEGLQAMQTKTGKRPTKPLCKECLEIVSRAHPVDLAFVDVSEGHAEFPHKGATDELGNLGYIADETALRKNPPEFHMAADKLKEACTKRDNNWRMLTKRVFVDTEAHEQRELSGHKRAKIFCLVYTIESGHPRVPNIRETWGPKCDGFIVASNKTVPELGTVNIVHEGPEEYDNIWQKVRAMWSYIYDNYYNDYDFFHIGGDDLFLIVENLRLYLESEEIQTAANGGHFLPDGTETTQIPLFIGRRFAYWGNMDDIFISGGSGYTMNKAALKLLVTEGFPNYFPHAHTFSEDTMVAKVFRKFGVFPYPTQDEDGGERYMPFLPGHHWGYHLPKNKDEDWYAAYSINIKEGPEHCSPRSVAFHYVKDAMMLRLFALLYGKCPKEYLEQ